jgi:hypothetical protein
MEDTSFNGMIKGKCLCPQTTLANPVQVLLDLLLPLWHQDTKKEKRSDATTSHESSLILRLFIVLRLFIFFRLGGLNIITRRAPTARGTGKTKLFKLSHIAMLGEPFFFRSDDLLRSTFNRNIQLAHDELCVPPVHFPLPMSLILTPVDVRLETEHLGQLGLYASNPAIVSRGCKLQIRVFFSRILIIGKTRRIGVSLDLEILSLVRYNTYLIREYAISSIVPT